MSLAHYVLSNLRRRPARTALTVAAIALGMAAVVSLTGISWGFEASWQKANDARGTDLIVTRLSSENALPSAFAAQAVAGKLAGYAHVRQVVGLLSEMLSVGEGLPPVFVFGWEHGSYLWEHLKLVSGRWPASDAEPVVLLGSTAATLLKRKPGDTLDLEGRHFVIAGVFESAAVVENGALLMTLGRAQELMDKPGKVNVLNIKLDGAASDAEIEALRSAVRTDLPGFMAITSGELVRANAIVRISKAMSAATILIAGLVGALVVFNTMLMSVSERVREIGLLLALGWERRTVVLLFCLESALQSLAGGVLGIVAGIAVSTLLEHLELMRGKIEAVYSLPFFGLVLGLSLLLGLAGGLYPALKASRLRPAQALRYE